jgi:putative heme-binding domain-containing protein
VRALGETASWQPWHFEVVRAALQNADPFVRRAAAEALSKHPAEDNVVPLLALLSSTDQEDTELYHETRIALRDQLRTPAVADHLLALKLSPDQRKQLVEFAATAPSGPAAMLVLDEALSGRVDDALLVKALPSAARYLDASRVAAVIEYIEQRFPSDAARQLAMFRDLADGLNQRGLPLTDQLSSKLATLMKPALSGDLHTQWYNVPLAGVEATASPWLPQQRPQTDGSSVMAMISSLPPGGERLGGVLHSPEFEIPPKMTFWMCGHDGLPNAPRRKNYVRLVLEDGAEIARSYPPRTDMARKFEWQLGQHAGKRGHVEVVDGIMDLDGFAWLAVSRFEPAVISVPDEPVANADAMRRDMFRMAGQYKLTSLLPDVAGAADAKEADVASRLAATEALLALEPAKAVGPLAAMIGDATIATASRVAAAEQLGRIDSAAAQSSLVAQLKAAPQPVAVAIAAGLASHRASAELLLKEIREGRASAALLREPAVADHLKASGVERIEQQIAELTANLSPADDRVAKLIAERRAGYLAGHYDAEVGKAVFAKSICASCHRIGDVGKTIGPALDGIGVRGLDRLLEDTLDPNRNVDAAFRTVLIETDGGQVLSGFELREEAGTLVFNNEKGEQVRLPLEEVVSRRQSSLSPMPTNVIEQIPERDYYALLAYLLSLKGK